MLLNYIDIIVVGLVILNVVKIIGVYIVIYIYYCIDFWFLEYWGGLVVVY